MIRSTAAPIQLEQHSDNLISWEEFQERFLSREDQYKYEWVNGIVQQTKRAMQGNQFFILHILQNLIRKLKSEKDLNWDIIPEGDMFFNGNHRRPDIAFYTIDQIKLASEGKNVIPKFVIEVISSNDQMNRVHQKMEDYYNSDVEVIWHILPAVKQVHIYRGRNMEVKKDDEICSANSVIEGFEIEASQLFI